MRLSELEGKEVINLHNGERLGLINETELVFDSKTGALESILLPIQRGFFSRGEELEVPWDAIVKIGTEIIIVDLPLEMM
ncbi:YlmC/YmxH family sporulation protein [Halanaerobaculum tunisiense]